MNSLTRALWMVILLSSSALLVSGQGWRGLRPIQSSRTDVERLLGMPIDSERSIYDVDDLRVNVHYSDGRCAAEDDEDWNVAFDTVIQIDIYPRVRRSPADFQVTIENLVRVHGSAATEVANYTSLSAGVSIAVNRKGEVVSIEYFPLVSEDAFRCPSGVRVPALASKFDEYGDLIWDDEMARLNNFSGRIEQLPDFVAYIIGYSNSDLPDRNGAAIAQRAKTYLVSQRSLLHSRIITINGGKRNGKAVELYVLPPSAPPPKATPQ